MCEVESAYTRKDSPSENVCTYELVKVKKFAMRFFDLSLCAGCVCSFAKDGQMIGVRLLSEEDGKEDDEVKATVECV